jgi:hypothetical protein
MKRVFAVSFLALFALAACKRADKVRVVQTDEGVSSLLSVVHMADPNAAPQLVKGFHAVEQNAWRWTMGAFTVVLRPPRDAATKGAVLNLKLSVPDPVINKLKAVTLSAMAGTQRLAPESYTQPGEYEYTRDVDASVLKNDSVSIEFTLDKFLAAGEVDGRELGIVVSSVGLESK